MELIGSTAGKMQTGGVYLITNKTKNLRYVGKSSKLWKRFCEHRAPCASSAFYAKYKGMYKDMKNDEFIFEVIEYSESEEFRKMLEVFNILKHNSIKNGYNSSGRIINKKDSKGQLVSVYSNLSHVKEHGYVISSVWKCCNGKMKTHKNFYWEYA